MGKCDALHANGGPLGVRKGRIGSEKCSKLHEKALEAGIQIANKIAACGPHRN